MSGRVVKTPGAWLDLEDVAAYLWASSPDSAERFLQDAEDTFARLAARPGIGERYRSEDPRFTDVRIAMLSRFKSYIVFYSPITDGIKIWHVFHGARNYDAILADEFGPDNDDEALDP